MLWRRGARRQGAAGGAGEESRGDAPHVALLAALGVEEAVEARHGGARGGAGAAGAAEGVGVRGVWQNLAVLSCGSSRRAEGGGRFIVVFPPQIRPADPPVVARCGRAPAVPWPLVALRDNIPAAAHTVGQRTAATEPAPASVRAALAASTACPPSSRPHAAHTPAVHGRWFGTPRPPKPNHSHTNRRPRPTA